MTIVDADDRALMERARMTIVSADEFAPRCVRR